MTSGREQTRVFVWDLDETLIIFQTLASGRYAQHFKGLKDSRYGIKLGRRWEKLIIQVCDECFFYEQVENYNQPTLQSWKKYDDGIDLTNYDFSSDELTEVLDELNNKKLAYRHRKISHLYNQGVEGLLNEEQMQEWKELYDQTDSYTDGWLTAGRNILKQCLEPPSSTSVDGVCSTRSVHVLVTSGSLVPSLVKLLLFKLDKFFSHENVYSSTEVGKLDCFKCIKQRFEHHNTKFCVIGDGLDECEAAQVLRWPFVRIDAPPDGPVLLTSISLPVIECYMRVIYGNNET